MFDHQRKNPLDFTVFKEVHPSSHESKMAFRLTMPFFAYMLHLNCPQTFFLQILFGFGIFILTGLIIKRDTQSSYLGLLGVLAVSCTYAGKLSFIQYGGVFDGTSIFFLLLSIYSKNVFGSFFALQFAFFNDERAVFASLFVLTYYIVVKDKSNIISFFLSLTAFITARFFIENYYNVSIPLGENSGISLDLVTKHIGSYRLQIDFIRSLEGFWLIVAFALFKSKDWKINTLIVFSIASVAGIAMIVWDIQRSMAYIMPVVFVSILISYRNVRNIKLEQIFESVLIICLILPSNPIAFYYHDVGPANMLLFELYEIFFK